MAIVVDYTPYQAVFDLATQAGQAAGTERAAQRSHQAAMIQLQSRLQKENFLFQERMAQQARQEKMEHDMALLQAKKGIDMQMDLQAYAMQRQRLDATMNLIENSSMSESEKEQFRIQAMAKYAGVGSGITTSLSKTEGGIPSGMDFLMKGMMREQMMNQWAQEVESGQMSPEEFKQKASAYGFSADYKDPSVIYQENIATAQRNLREANKELTQYYVEKGEDVYVAKKPGEASKQKVKPGTPAYDHYHLLKANQQDAISEMKRTQSTKPKIKPTEADLMAFQQAVEKSPSLQKALEEAIKMFGEERGVEYVREQWAKQNEVVEPGKTKPKMPWYLKYNPVMRQQPVGYLTKKMYAEE